MQPNAVQLHRSGTAERAHGAADRADLHRLVDGPLVRPTSSAAVGIIVVTHNSRAVIDTCLTSLRTEAGPDVQVVVVDNRSTDGTADFVASNHDWVTLVRKRRCSGFATNCNIGVAATRARHVVLLNPDTVVQPGAIAILLSYLDENPDVGVAAPRLVYSDGRHQPSARLFPTAATGVVRRTPLRWIFRNTRLERQFLRLDEPPELQHPTDIDWALGAALAVNGGAWEALGGLDDRFRLYCEDVDLCWRSHVAGWAVRYVPDAVVVHELAEHTRRHFFTPRTIWHLRSLVRFARKHGLRPPEGSPSAQRSR